MLYCYAREGYSESRWVQCGLWGYPLGFELFIRAGQTCKTRTYFGKCTEQRKVKTERSVALIYINLHSNSAQLHSLALLLPFAPRLFCARFAL